MEIGCEDGRWMELAQDRVQWRASVVAVLNVRVVLAVGYLVNSLVKIPYLRLSQCQPVDPWPWHCLMMTSVVSVHQVFVAFLWTLYHLQRLLCAMIIDKFGSCVFFLEVTEDLGQSPLSGWSGSWYRFKVCKFQIQSAACYDMESGDRLFLYKTCDRLTYFCEVYFGNWRFGYQGLFPWGKAAGTWSWPLTSI
jgi:hypothetical protein